MNNVKISSFFFSGFTHTHTVCTLVHTPDQIPETGVHMYSQVCVVQFSQQKHYGEERLWFWLNMNKVNTLFPHYVDKNIIQKCHARLPLPTTLKNLVKIITCFKL